MRYHHRPTNAVCADMTPMIDVVFLLIIFFLVSSHLVQQETQLDLQLPDAATADEEQTQRPRVTINVLADGRMLLAGQELAIDQITQRLTFQRSNSKSNFEVRIRGDRSALYSTVEPLLVACAEAGVWNVSFAVRDGEG